MWYLGLGIWSFVLCSGFASHPYVNDAVLYNNECIQLYADCGGCGEFGETPGCNHFGGTPEYADIYICFTLFPEVEIAFLAKNTNGEKLH